MGLFDFFKKGPSASKMVTVTGPYHDPSINHLYEMLFCDNAELFRINQPDPQYPWNLLLSANPSKTDLERIINDSTLEPRVKLLACYLLRSTGQQVLEKELLGIIVEVGLDQGLDVLASYRNCTARYINQTGKLIVWENTEDVLMKELTDTLFSQGLKIVKQIGPWDKGRKPWPPLNSVRLSFLVADGLYFGEGAVNVLFNDPMAAPALSTATQMMQYLIKSSLDKKER